MRKNYLTFLLSIFTVLYSLPCTVKAQEKGGIDAVAISKNYYNSIVKILLYDSAMAKISPDKAFIGRGSGFFVSEDGYIFTNRHVINMCQGYYRYQTYNPDTKNMDEGVDVYTPSALKDLSISKITYTGRSSALVQVYDNDMGTSYKLYYARVIAIDTANFDGAIIKIVSDLNGKPVDEKFHTVPIGNSDSTSQGQDLCLYGFPMQFNGSFDEMLKDLSTLIFGKHSGFDFFINTQYGFIKTDAVINNGNSGGPVFGPGNKVIGLATAAFQKTNVGLVGGINGMYDLAALIPDLQKTLVAHGFTPPLHKPNALTVSFYKPTKLPTKGQINHANHNPKKEGTAHRPVFFDISLRGAVVDNGTFTLTPVNNGTNGLSSTGGTFNVSGLNEPGINLRLCIPTLFKQKNNLIGLIFSATIYFYGANWSFFQPSLYVNDTTTHNKIFSTNYSYNPAFIINPMLGLSYTQVLTNNMSIGIYYEYGAFMGSSAKLGSITNPNQGGSSGPGSGPSNSPSNSDMRLKNDDGVHFCQAIGLLYRVRHLVIGFEYKFISNEKINIEGDNLGPGNVQGTYSGNPFTITLGVAITGKRKQ